MRGCVCLLILACFSCSSMENAVENSLSDSLSGYTKKGVPIKKSKTAQNDPMLALTGETDTRLIADFFPTALKMFDIMQAQNPKHIGIAIMTGSLHVMYANAFIQTPAERLSIAQFDAQNAEYERAVMHYLRGRDLILDALERKYAGFKADVVSGEKAQIARAAAKLTKDDVNAAYWLGAGWLGAFSLDPLNLDLLMSMEGAVAVLETAAAFAADYSGGAIWDILCAFYAAAPADFGGSLERAEYCFEQSLRAAGGTLPGPYVTYAQSICVPRQDAESWTRMLNKALAVNPDDAPDSRLASTITQQRARWLLDHKDNYFLEW